MMNFLNVLLFAAILGLAAALAIGIIFHVAWVVAFFCGVDLVPWVQGLSA
jgi:hypothetical protein